MTLWNCFICGSDSVCAHREPELVIWAFSAEKESITPMKSAQKVFPFYSHVTYQENSAIKKSA